ncbi:sigma-70 family RNA polymerase sigma factor [Paraburkholderia sp.]|uniref:sigma-70 family RNA polymerase sigma factor n=1 Tax=Paraburkholderia sp. TaxID=1926495 RepID=UPI00286EC2C2|nr:sigma-70 family RNA polymerase sigma factor [Paraburkholderia sp.]
MEILAERVNRRGVSRGGAPLPTRRASRTARDEDFFARGCHIGARPFVWRSGSAAKPAREGAKRMTQMSDEISDEACVEADAEKRAVSDDAAQGDTIGETWDESRRAGVFAKERARLLALAARVLGSRAEAEDVVQDAWFRWRDGDAAAVRTPQAWLATVTVRLAIDRLRKLRRESAGERDAAWLAPWLGDTAPSAEETGLRAAQLSDGLLLMLDRLGPLEQAVFVLREAFDCDYAEIAALTGCASAHCRQIVHRARVRLAREQAPQSAPADAARHAFAVERLREVLHAQDRAGLLDLLGVTATALTQAGEATQLRALHAETLVLDGAPGVALVAHDGALAAWLHVREDEDGCAAPVVCVAGQDRHGPTFSAANHAFQIYGEQAVQTLLARFKANDAALQASMRAAQTLAAASSSASSQDLPTQIARPLAFA